MRNTVLKTIDDEALVNVAGGDWGDSKYELENNLYLYGPGDTVEVYDNFLHITTTKAEVLTMGRRMGPVEQYIRDGFMIPFYLVQYENGSKEWVTSNVIERK